MNANEKNRLLVMALRAMQKDFADYAGYADDSPRPDWCASETQWRWGRKMVRQLAELARGREHSMYIKAINLEIARCRWLTGASVAPQLSGKDIVINWNCANVALNNSRQSNR